MSASRIRQRRSRNSAAPTSGYLILVATVVATFVSTSTATVANGICDLACPTSIGATCVFGDAPASQVTGGSSGNAGAHTSGDGGGDGGGDGMHCSCPNFYTGVLCDVLYESCGDGQHRCYHGGACVGNVYDDYGNAQLYCDCESAVDASDSGSGYIGKYCEHKTVAANEAELTCVDGNGFCVNGGVCNDKYPDFGLPCLCQGEFTGPRCQYTNGDDSTTVVAEPQQPPTTPAMPSCPCENGGTCESGTFSDSELAQEYRFWETPSSLASTNQYCRCPDNWDGPLCTVPRIACGNEHCFHNAACFELANPDGTFLHRCDCDAASLGANSYAGRFCQYSSTMDCTDDPSSNLFCVNGGTCRANAHEGCDCPTGYTGFSCEFLLQDGAPDAMINEPGIFVDTDDYINSCDLECLNGGRCRHGNKQNHAGLDVFASNTEHLSNEAGTSHTLTHCVCPDQWAGTYCEHQVDACPESQHLCLHGGACVNEGDDLLCDCGQANSNLATFFAGNHCEHPVHDICTEGVEATSATSKVTFSSAVPGRPLAFCVNGGKCKKKVAASEGHPGCLCQEGFLGPHCELRESPEVPLNTNIANPYNSSTNFDQSSGGHGFETAVLCIAILSIVVVSVFSVTTYIRRRQQNNAAITSSVNWSPSYRDRPAEVNIAPKRSSSMVSDAVYETATREASRGSTNSSTTSATSSTRPSSSMVTAPRLARENEDDNVSEDDSPPEPKIYLGPPRDEDGHVLHSVDIV